MHCHVKQGKEFKMENKQLDEIIKLLKTINENLLIINSNLNEIEKSYGDKEWL